MLPQPVNETPHCFVLRVGVVYVILVEVHLRLTGIILLLPISDQIDTLEYRVFSRHRKLIFHLQLFFLKEKVPISHSSLNFHLFFILLVIPLSIE